jgi:hypothetical protein
VRKAAIERLGGLLARGETTALDYSQFSALVRDLAQTDTNADVRKAAVRRLTVNRAKSELLANMAQADGEFEGRAALSGRQDGSV